MRARLAVAPLAVVPLVLLALVVGGRAGLAQDDGPAPGGPAPAEVEKTPPPFTAEQIRDATKVGRRYRFQIEVMGMATTNVMEFTAVTAEGATMRRTEVLVDGKEAPATEQQVTWDELVAHASFPKAMTTVTEEEVTVPAGTFRCKVYVVRERGAIGRFAFAIDLPGAPISMEMTQPGRDGKPVVIQRMTLLEHRPGT